MNWAVGVFEKVVAVCATEQEAMSEAESRVVIAKRNRSALVWEEGYLIEKLGIARVSRFPHARVFPTQEPVTVRKAPEPLRAATKKKQATERDRARAIWESLTDA